MKIFVGGLCKFVSVCVLLPENFRIDDEEYLDFPGIEVKNGIWHGLKKDLDFHLE